MESQNHGSNDGKLANGHHANSLGYVTSILITLLTIVTFGIAICTPPLSGPYCSGPCFQYPFLDIASRFPRDYIWMYPAIALTILFVIWIVCIHQFATSDKKVFSQIGMALAAIAATILVSDYFVQISVIQPSILNGETDGIPVLTQYNPHGLFIALEEIGYLLMSLALFFVSQVFSKPGKIERAIKRIFITGFILTLVSLIIIGSQYGINREYRFEVAAITINWMVMIISGIPMSILFKRALG